MLRGPTKNQLFDIKNTYQTLIFIYILITGGGGPAAAGVVDDGGSKTVHDLMLCFCEKVDVGAKSMARKVLALCPQAKRLTLKFGH